ncbi:hypothetical protein VN0370_01380 [Helicobacter pylori]
MCVLCGELIRSFHWTDGTDGSGSYEIDENLKGQNALISVSENARERKRARLKREWDCSIKFWRFMG